MTLLFFLFLVVPGCSDDDPARVCVSKDLAGRLIAADDPYPRQIVTVGPDSEEFISYLDEGTGSPVIFLHGAPTSSYLWRNIIPYVSDSHRAIALDLVGFGRSGSPAGAGFRYPEHQAWLANFIEALDLKDITFVVHDIGSVIGFDYAAKHPERVRALVHLEALYFPIPSLDMLPPEAAFIMTEAGQEAILKDNWFIETMVPAMLSRELCPDEFAAYAAPWKDEGRRRALQTVPLDLPIAGIPEDNQDSFDAFGQYLTSSDVPKLFLYGEPGVLVQDVVAPGFPASLRDIVSGFPNTTSTSIGAGLHFLQEDNPHDVGQAISDFLDAL